MKFVCIDFETATPCDKISTFFVEIRNSITFAIV
jgi:hypothetical protein